jgi:hypothetical protein
MPEYLKTRVFLKKGSAYQDRYSTMQTGSSHLFFILVFAIPECCNINNNIKLLTA